MGCANRPGFPALVAGGAIFLQGALVRLLFSADPGRVYFLGHPILLECALRSKYGLPCPTCGMTRSVVLALHGDFALAWQLSPGGVAAVLGMALLGLAAWALALTQWRRAAKWEAAVWGAVRRWAPVYGAAATVVWLAGWVSQFEAAMRLR
jgi:hypothetical protein